MKTSGHWSEVTSFGGSVIVLMMNRLTLWLSDPIKFLFFFHVVVWMNAI